MMQSPMDPVSPLRRLRESVVFFSVYWRPLLQLFIVLYLPVMAATLMLPQGPRNGFPTLAFIFDFLYQPIYTGALIYQLARIESGRPWTVKEGFVTGVRLWDKLLLVNLVSLALTLVGLMVFIVPGLVAYARLALAEFRVVLAGDVPKDALKGSFEMTRPFTLSIITCTAVLFGVFLLLQLGIEWLTATVAMPRFFLDALHTLLSVVLMVYLTILLFRFYGLAQDTVASPP